MRSLLNVQNDFMNIRESFLFLKTIQEEHKAKRTNIASSFKKYGVINKSDEEDMDYTAYAFPLFLP